MNDTKEEMLSFIKKETGWDDARCEEFLVESIKKEEEQEKFVQEQKRIEEELALLPKFYVYRCFDKNGNEQVKFAEGSIDHLPTDSYWDAALFHNKKQAMTVYKEIKAEQREEREHQAAWDNYMNPKPPAKKKKVAPNIFSWEDESESTPYVEMLSFVKKRPSTHLFRFSIKNADCNFIYCVFSSTAKAAIKIMALKLNWKEEVVKNHMRKIF